MPKPHPVTPPAPHVGGKPIHPPPRQSSAESARSDGSARSARSAPMAKAARIDQSRYVPPGLGTLINYRDLIGPPQPPAVSAPKPKPPKGPRSSSFKKFIWVFEILKGSKNVNLLFANFKKLKNYSETFEFSLDLKMFLHFSLIFLCFSLYV